MPRELFKVNEVCTLTGVKPYVLRFWETEFAEISPMTSPSGQKLYDQKDLDVIGCIKNLLFEEKLTIERAKLELPLRLHPAPQENQDLNVEESAVEVTIDREDKIVLAKNKIIELIQMTKELQQSHQWMD